jgi:hypothetical protein
MIVTVVPRITVIKMSDVTMFLNLLVMTVMSVLLIPENVMVETVSLPLKFVMIMMLVLKILAALIVVVNTLPYPVTITTHVLKIHAIKNLDV